MDKRIKYRLVVDTETCPLDRTQAGVKGSNSLVYDLGFAVIDKRGNVYETGSIIIDEIFNGEQGRMQSAYYQWKIPQYRQEIAEGKRTVMKIREARQTILDVAHKYNIHELYAHNAAFDFAALNATVRYLNAYDYFLPWGFVICDSMKMATQVICGTPTYQRFCRENGFVTKKNQVRKTAEVLYRYISNDLSFLESHTALEDVLIEKDIVAYCFRKHKSMNRVLWANV